MKYKKYILVFVIFAVIVSVSSGCGDQTAETKNEYFVKYDMASIMPKTECKISNTTESATVYFPAVTNKEITGTQLCGVAAKLPPTKENIKVTLRAEAQDKINFRYRDKYISFLKYRVIIESKETLQSSDVITLCDTALWIYHNSEFRKIQIDNDYLRITVVDGETESPNWEGIIADMQSAIERLLSAT